MTVAFAVGLYSDAIAIFMPVQTSAGAAQPFFAIDSQKFLFSFSSYIAAAATLAIAFSASLPRPWWALLTVYVTAQPMAGAFRPKIFYRLGGIVTGAVVTVALVPNLQNSPELLILCLAAWTGFCIYLAFLIGLFLFAVSTIVVLLPYLRSAPQPPALLVPVGIRGLVRGAFFRAHRRLFRAARKQLSDRRGTCRYRTHGASSQAFRRGPTRLLSGLATGKISCFPSSSSVPFLIR